MATGHSASGVSLTLKALCLLSWAICLAQGGSVMSQETGEEKSLSYTGSEESGHASHKTYTRVSAAHHPPSPGGAQGATELHRNPAASSSGDSGFRIDQSEHSSSSAAHSSSRHVAESRSSSQRSHSSAAGRSPRPEDSQADDPSAAGSRGSMSELDRVSAMAADTEQRAYFRELFSRRCKDCEVNGQKFRGHSRFEYREGCNRYRCICSCDGSYNCPPRYTMDVCKTEEEGGGQATATRSPARRRRCQRCEAFGQQFEGNAYFDAQDGCTKYRGCICYCNGTWTCPSERAVDTCQTTTTAPVPACRACNAKGKVVEGNSYFELEEPCRRFRYCRCACDGTWQCPEQFAEDTCRSAAPEDEAIPGCQTCDAKGQQVTGNTYFQMTDGCIHFKNCVCRCNGSWSCPSQYARNICDDQESEGGSAGQDTALPASSIAECQSCLAHGSYFRGNTYFSTRSGCTQYERCVCRCDGSWDCPARFATNVCDDDDPSNDQPTDTCSYCDANGKIITSNTYFNMTEGCVHYEQCLCHCDGQWVCPERASRNICEDETREEASQPSDCSSCLVDSRVVRGNSYFDHVTGCYRYRDCLCKCDGNYECREDRAENICAYNRTAAAAVAASSSSSSSAQSSSSSSDVSSAASSASSSSTSSSSSSSGPSCLRCFAYGQFYSPNTQFLREEGCYQYTCHCHCNGSFTCPAERVRNTCGRGCRECQVDGQVFQGNTYFRHRRGCVEYLCTCYCNGSYDCPADRANNTCPVSSEDVDGRSTVTDVARLERNGCTRCVTDDGSSHSPDSDFTLTEGCIHYQCRCNCDGSWTCPGEAARNVCRGEVLGGCRSCVISETQIFRGDEDFQMREGCVHYMCRCNCDGSWECPGEQARDICLGEVPGGCRVCRVSENETYRGDTQFPLRQGCYHYLCNCHCNGSWECPGDTARDVCIGEVPGGCRVCKLDDGQVFLGESDFTMEKECVRYNCRCNCDGSWNCPGERARRVCNADGSPLDRPRPTTVTTTTTGTERPPQSSCRRCVVSEAEQFVPNAAFTLRRGCNEYRCRCECDGSWACPGEQARDLCGARDDARLRAQTCASCTVSSYTYPGRSTFLLTRDCAQYTCQCDCTGRWSCDHTNTRNICTDSDSRVLTSGASSGARRTAARTFASSSSSSSSSSASSSSAVTASQQQSRRGGSGGSTRGSSVTAANLGSAMKTSRPSGPCVPCRVDGRDYAPESDFAIDKKCRRFNCFCACNGRWRCPRDRTEDLCPDDTAAVSGASSQSSRQRQGERTAGTAYRQEATTGQRYGQTRVRVVGADTAAYNAQTGQAGQGRVRVEGFYVDPRQPSPHTDRDTRTQAYGQAAQQAVYSQANYQQGGSAAQQGYDARQQQYDAQQAAYSQTGYQQGGTAAQQGYDARQQQYDARQQQYDARQAAYSQTGYQQGGTAAQQGYDMRQQQYDAQQAAYTQTGYQQGGSAAQQGYDGQQQTQHSQGQSQYGAQSAVSAAAFASSSPDSPVTGAGEGEGGATCTPCQVDDRTYRAGAKFNWRRGCIIYKCSCLCSGSYRCGLSVDPNCSKEDAAAGAGGLPTGPLASGPSAAQPGGACGNCYVSGYVYPGNMSFTLREGCNELSCRCGCDGNHQCSEPRVLAGCTAVSTPLAGAVYPYGAAPAVYPVGAGGYAVRPGRIVSGYQQTFYSGVDCPTCVQGGGAGGVLIPALMAGTNRFPLASQPQASASQFFYSHSAAHSPLSPLSPQPQSPLSPLPPQPQVSGGVGKTSVQRVAMRPVDVSDEVLADSMVDKTCATCFVNGQSHRGSFDFTKDCYHVTCYCDCSGWLRCSVQPALTEACPAQYGPVSGQCRSCVVAGHEYPPNLHFALRVACYGYDCSCGCDGQWMCPTQQPTNYCVQPAAPPTRLEEQGYDVMAAERGGAGLTDATFSRSVDDSMLQCRDCQVRGTAYPSRTRFLLREGCSQHTCDCACDGSWACPKNETVDVCQQGRPHHAPDPSPQQQAERERRQRAEKEELRRVVAESERSLALRAAQQAKMAASADQAECRSCQVDGRRYLTEQDFQYRRGCHLFTCHCFCNGSWSCPASETRDVCRQDPRQPDACLQCHLGNKTYPGNSAFAYRQGCWEFNCQCGCNGRAQCPPHRSRDLCNAGGSPPAVDAGGDGDDVASLREADDATSSGCKPCLVDGQVIRSRRAFHQKRGCREFLCQCACNGSWSCPADRSLDVCQLEREEAQQATEPTQPQGCKVGRRTHFTRLFALTEGCLQHMCICHHDGTWRCPPGNQIYIC